MKTALGLRLILGLVAAALLAGCSLSVSSDPSPSASAEVKAGKGTFEEVTFTSGVTCTTVRSAQGVGVSCDFSALDGTDLPDQLEQAEFTGGTLHQVTVEGRLCVSAETAQGIGVDCQD